MEVPSSGLAAWLAQVKDQGRLQILSRPQIMTLENQPASIQIGNRVPRITDSEPLGLEKADLVLKVTPHVTPKGLVVIDFDLECSRLFFDRPGVDMPDTGITKIQTTISADGGQTVILGGMMTVTNGEPRGVVVTATPHVNPTMQ